MFICTPKSVAFISSGVWGYLSFLQIFCCLRECKDSHLPLLFLHQKTMRQHILEQQSKFSFTVYVSQVFLSQQNVCCWFRDLSCLLSTRVAVTAEQSDLLLCVLCDPQGKRSCEMLIISNTLFGFNLSYSKVSQSVLNLYPKLGHP